MEIFPVGKSGLGDAFRISSGSERAETAGSYCRITFSSKSRLLQMAQSIHAVMQDANDGNAVRGDAKINHVPLNIVAAIAGPDMIASRGNHWRACQLAKGGGQHVDVPVGLPRTPLPASVAPDIFQVMFGCRGKAIFSHAQPAFFP